MRCRGAARSLKLRGVFTKVAELQQNPKLVIVRLVFDQAPFSELQDAQRAPFNAPPGWCNTENSPRLNTAELPDGDNFFVLGKYMLDGHVNVREVFMEMGDMTPEAAAPAAPTLGNGIMINNARINQLVQSGRILVAQNVLINPCGNRLNIWHNILQLWRQDTPRNVDTHGYILSD